MATREEFIAALPSKCARKTAAILDAALETEASLAMSFDALAEFCRISRASVGKVLRILKLVGLVDIGRGPFQVSVLSSSRRWEALSAADVAQVLAQPRPQRVRQLASPPRPPRKPVEAVQDELEPEPQYQTPSLPKLRFMGEL